MASFTFEDLFTGTGVFEVSGNADLFEVGGTAPVNIIQTNQDWLVRIDMTTVGIGTGSIGGQWNFRIYLEGLGTLGDLDLPAAPFTVAMTPGPSPVNYGPFNINIPQGSVPAGSYKLVVAATHTDLAGNPGPIAGFAELGLVQFYDGP